MLGIFNSYVKFSVDKSSLNPVFEERITSIYFAPVSKLENIVLIRF